MIFLKIILNWIFFRKFFSPFNNSIKFHKTFNYIYKTSIGVSCLCAFILLTSYLCKEFASFFDLIFEWFSLFEFIKIFIKFTCVNCKMKKVFQLLDMLSNDLYLPKNQEELKTQQKIEKIHR